jgi:hypothetical protein
MKSQIIAGIIVCYAGFISAQDLTSKKGFPILPEAGDWAIGIDANPFLNYAGNFFGKGGSVAVTSGTVQTASHYTNQAPTWNFIANNFNISGKKMIDANTAYRAALRIGFNNVTKKNQVTDRSITTAPVYPAVPFRIENTWKQTYTNIGISLGMEKRKGKNRLQGIYGAEAGIGFSSGKNVFKYGNQLSTSTSNPVSVSTDDGFDADLNTSGVQSLNLTKDTYNNDARILKEKSGVNFEIGVRAFVGAEYFVAPKISLGGEFGWGIGLGFTGKTKTTLESIGNNGSELVVGQQELSGDKSTRFLIDTDNQNSMFGPTGRIRVNFYF